MKWSLIGLVGVMACGSSSTTPVEEVTFGDDEVVEGQTDEQKVRALFDQEIAAMRAADADAALASHALGPDSFMLGPVAAAVLVGGDAVEATVRQVMASWQPMEISVTEHALAVVGDAAYSGHEVTYEPPGSPSITYHAVQLYRSTPAGWRVVATSWTVALPEERWLPLAQANAMPESAPVAARIDPGCETAAADVEGLRNDQLPPTERVVGSFTLGTDPGEAKPFSQEEYDGIAGAIESGVITSAPGAGGVHAQRVGDLCFVVAAVNRTAHLPDQELNLRMRAVSVFDTRSGTHRLGSFSLVLPDGPPEPAEGAPASDEAAPAEPAAG